jgi:HK97 family phage portal protein
MNLNPFAWFRREPSRTNLSIEEMSRMFDAESVSASGVAVGPETAMRCATVFACVRVLAESEAQLPLLVYHEDSKGNKTRDKAHSLYWVLNVQANEWQTAYEFREMMMCHLALRGNAYAYKSIASNGKLLELIPLHPDRMAVKQQSDYTMQYVYGGKPLPTANVLHIRGLSLDGITGVSPITYARDAVGLAMATERTGSGMFKNGIHAQGFLTTPGSLKPEQVDQMAKAWQERYGGSQNSGKPAILHGGLDWKAVGLNATDAQYLETRKFQRTEICSIFRVPPHMIGDLERATFSNIEHQSLEFVSRTLMPWLRRFEQVITRDLIGPRDQGSVYVEHLVDAMLRGDTLSRYQAYGQGIRDGWINRNEVRSRENMNKVEGLDEYLLPLNMGTESQVTNPDPRITPEPPATK